MGVEDCNSSLTAGLKHRSISAIKNNIKNTLISNRTNARPDENQILTIAMNRDKNAYQSASKITSTSHYQTNPNKKSHTRVGSLGTFDDLVNMDEDIRLNDTTSS